MSETWALLINRPAKIDQVVLGRRLIEEQEYNLALLGRRLSIARAQLPHALDKHNIYYAQYIRAKGQLQTNRNRLFAAPIPPELLLRIFQLCLQADPKVAWILSSVCLDWRKVALMPQMWSDVVVPFGDMDRNAALDLWLARSQAVCISITFHAIYKSGNKIPTLHELQQTLGILLPHLRRCQHFEFCSNVADFVQTCLDLPFGAIPNMITLSIRTCPNEPRLSMRYCQPCRHFKLTHAPSLTTVTLHECVPWAFGFLSSPTLTSVTLVTTVIRRRLADVWTILQLCCESVENLAVFTSIDNQLESTLPQSPQYQSITFPHLISLSGNVVLIDILPRLVAPALTTLSVDAADSQELLDVITDFNIRSHPSLVTLRLKSISGPLVIGLDVALRSVRRLEIVDCTEVDDIFFLSLTLPAISLNPSRLRMGWPLPNLETLVMRGLPRVGPASVQRLVESRNPVVLGSNSTTNIPSPARLCGVEIKDCQKIALPEFGQWIQERLKISGEMV